MKKKTLSDLFAKREQVIEKTTTAIFKSMAGALEAIHDVMNHNDLEKEGGVLVWETAELADDEQNPLIILIGVIIYPPGVEVTLPTGDKIVVTKDTAPYFRRLVRAGIPLDIADQPKVVVVDYLVKMKEDDIKQAEITAMDQSINNETEFDLSKLSEEQRRVYDSLVGGKTIGKA